MAKTMITICLMSFISGKLRKPHVLECHWSIYSWPIIDTTEIKNTTLLWPLKYNLMIVV